MAGVFTLFSAPAAGAVEAALASAGAGGPVAVLGQPRLARALASRRAVITVAPPAVSLRRAPGPRAYAAERALPVRGGALGGVVACAPAAGWDEAIAEWSRAVRDGGAIVIVDRVAAPEAARRALCAGLVDIEQRHAGRTVVTSGRVKRGA
jgi:hypothetical protein